jgi:hypothetical protein
MIAYAALHLGGGSAIVILNWIVAICGLALAVACAMRQSCSAVTVSIVGLLALPLLAIGYLPIRAQAYSFACFAALLLAVELDRAGRRWWIPAWLLIFLLWLNIHGSCVLAFGVLGCYWAEGLLQRSLRWRVLAVLLAMGGMLALNPNGTDYYRYLVRTLSMSRLAIREWGPVGTYGTDNLSMIVILIALIVYAIAKRKVSLYGICLLAASAAAGLMHWKMIPYFGVVSLAMLPGFLSGTALERECMAIMDKNAGRIVLAGLIVASVTGLVLFGSWRASVPSSFPVGAVEYLKQQRFSGNLMADFNQGAYVIWNLYPAVKVSMDSRFDVAYPTSVVFENQGFFTNGSGLREFVAKYPTDAVLAARGGPAESALVSAVWKRVYCDSAFAVFASPALTLPIANLATVPCPDKVTPR